MACSHDAAPMCDDPERARRHARILGDMLAASEVATAQDVGDLRAEIAELRTEMLEAEQRLRAELHREIGAVRGEMGALAWKMAGLPLAQAAAIVALVKLLPGAVP